MENFKVFFKAGITEGEINGNILHITSDLNADLDFVVVETDNITGIKEAIKNKIRNKE